MFRFLSNRNSFLSTLLVPLYDTGISDDWNVNPKYSSSIQSGTLKSPWTSWPFVAHRTGNDPSSRRLDLFRFLLTQTDEQASSLYSSSLYSCPSTCALRISMVTGCCGPRLPPCPPSWLRSPLSSPGHTSCIILTLLHSDHLLT